MKDYHERCGDLGEEARKLMLPYFKKRGWTYVAGNGTWFISRSLQGVPSFSQVRDSAIPDDKVPKWIQNLLWIEFDHNNLLGYHIRDIREDYAP